MVIISSTISDNSSTDALTGGGGISNGGTLTIISSTVTANRANDRGGGIFNERPLTVIASTISNNDADLSGGNRGGGGIFSKFAVTLTNSTISGNDSRDSGGISISGTLTMRNTTVSGNTALSAGGIRITGTATSNIVNSTISGNLANGGAGGIAVNRTATLNLSNVTIVNNEADSDSNGTGNGGGINAAAGVTVNLRNTILANNTANAGNGPNCFGTITVQGNDFFNANPEPGCTFVLTGFNNQLGNPKLGPLANNGGPNKTHALLPGSEAIDNGNASGCVDQNGVTLTTDQRGKPRPADGDVNGTARCDIGAFELQGPDIAVTKIGPNIVVTGSSRITYFIAVTNTGEITANSVALTDTYPAGTTGTSFFGATCPSLNPSLVCTIRQRCGVGDQHLGLPRSGDFESGAERGHLAGECT
jgi:uncharacterized repeat protein (TIGR01451 family)